MAKKKSCTFNAFLAAQEKCRGKKVDVRRETVVDMRPALEWTSSARGLRRGEVHQELLEES